MFSDLKKQLWLIGILFAIASLAAVAIATLLLNIQERKVEGSQRVQRPVDLTENDADPAKWGLIWPRQYDGYMRTEDPTHTKYGGAPIGPEGGLAPQKAERDPWLTRLFAGYLFSVDYRDRRGHAFMLEDQEITKRNLPEEGKQSGNCLHCHSSIMPLYRKLGAEALPEGSPEAQVQKGLEKVGQLGYWEAHAQLKDITGGPHPVSCLDCHDPKSSELRVTRPAFLTGIAALAQSDAPSPALPSLERWRLGDRSVAYNPNQHASRQEMRSFVCAQCHVEYFCGKGATIFFPWDKGLSMEQMEASYNARELNGKRFNDWVHAETGVGVLKAQHPEFEMWAQGVHAKSGVSCADCHMPYKREGAMKVSEHWVRSPLLQVNRSCQSYHPFPEAQLNQRVIEIQDRHHALMSRAGEASIDMIEALAVLKRAFDARWKEAARADAQAKLEKAADWAVKDAPARDAALAAETKAQLLARWQAHIAATPELKQAAELQRQAQWRLDLVAAENSMGFHAPQEMARILGESIDMARQAEIKARALAAQAPDAGQNPPDVVPEKGAKGSKGGKGK